MWLDCKSGWSVDECLLDGELTVAELAESDRLRDQAQKILATRSSLDPADGDWPDLAFLESGGCRLN